MKKELFFAIAAGLILGLIIAFGIWRVNKTIAPSDNQSSISQATPTPDTGFSITIANLEDLDVITESPFKISGITKPQTTVAISVEEKDYIVDTEKDGSFEKEISLIAGINEIVVKAFDQEGASSEVKIKIVYSSEFEKYLKEPEKEESTATDEADSIRMKVEEKLADALKNPKAYIGTITDIAETTYQIENQKGEIEQVSFDKDTTFVKIDKTSKVITSTDVAIGDSVIAMGFKNGNDVLEAKRILVTEISSDSTRNIFMGEYNDISKNVIDVTNLFDQEKLNILAGTDTDYVLIKDSKVSSFKLANLEKNQIIYIFGDQGEKYFESRTIYLIENTSSPSPSSVASQSPEATSENER